MKSFDGIPVGPDVEKLMEHFKERLNPNDGFEHKEIAEVIGEPYGSSRYRGVARAWRKQLLKEKNVDTLAVAGWGYRVLYENERVSVGAKGLSESRRKFGRSIDRISRADSAKLDPLHLQQQDHAMRLGSEVLESMRKVDKQISMAGKVQLLPRNPNAV